MDQVGLIVMVDERQRLEIDRIANSLVEKGLSVQQTLPRFRTITGVGDAQIVGELRKIQGVESVREDRSFQLPPVDEKIPQ